MFLLEILPSWIFYLVTALGLGLFVICQFASQVPLIKQYGIAAQSASILLILVGGYFVGANSNQEIWEDRVYKVENEMVVLSKLQPETNKIIVKEYIDRPVEVVTKHTEVIVKKIPHIITKEVDKKCEIPFSVIEIHNEAVEGI